MQIRKAKYFSVLVNPTNISAQDIFNSSGAVRNLSNVLNKSHLQLLCQGDYKCPSFFDTLIHLDKENSKLEVTFLTHWKIQFFISCLVNLEELYYRVFHRSKSNFNTFFATQRILNCIIPTVYWVNQTENKNIFRSQMQMRIKRRRSVHPELRTILI